MTVNILQKNLLFGEIIKKEIIFYRAKMLGGKCARQNHKNKYFIKKKFFGKMHKNIDYK